MEHLAIMRKSWGLTNKILTGEKIIESRWYTTKHAPWNKIHRGDIVYFKDSGEPVTIKTEVTKVMQFDSLTREKVHTILDTYGKEDGIDSNDLPIYKEMFQDKKYCILIFLKNVQKIKPFHINKKGYGTMATWIVTDDTGKIKL